MSCKQEGERTFNEKKAKLSDSNNKLSFFSACSTTWWMESETIVRRCFLVHSLLCCCTLHHDQRHIFIQLHIEYNMQERYSFNYRRAKQQRRQRWERAKNETEYWVHRLKLHITYYVAKYHVFTVQCSPAIIIASSSWRSPFFARSEQQRESERERFCDFPKR